MLNAIGKVYKVAWESGLGLVEGVDRIAEASLRPMVAVGAILGVLGIEAIYFTQAREVRLLFVLLLAVPGAAIGALVILFVGVFLRGVVWFLVFGALVVLSISPVVGLIWLLHAIIVWRN